MQMEVKQEGEAKRLPGLVELVSDRTYTFWRAIARANGSMPNGLTPGGTLFLIEVDKEPRQRAARFLVASHFVSQQERDNDPWSKHIERVRAKYIKEAAR